MRSSKSNRQCGSNPRLRSSALARFNGSAQQSRQYMPGSRGCNTELYSVRSRNSRRSGFRAVRSAIESGPSRPWRQGSAWRTRCRPLAAGCSVPRTGIAGDVHRPVRFGLPVAGLTDLVSLARCPACPSSPGYRCRAVPMWGRRRLLSGRSALPPAMSRVRFPSTGERRKSKYKYRRSYRLCVVDQAIRCRLFPAFDSTAPPISPAITSPAFSTNPSRRP